jgi:hypothetical protein
MLATSFDRKGGKPQKQTRPLFIHHKSPVPEVSTLSLGIMAYFAAADRYAASISRRRIALIRDW